MNHEFITTLEDYLRYLSKSETAVVASNTYVYNSEQMDTKTVGGFSATCRFSKAWP
jgi:2',3'-cyclic-nucleotide 2'-phosphodiesterase (5'-nucleotidase family)